MSLNNLAKTKAEWIEENKNSFEWLKQTYPFLNQFSFPLDYELIRDFYYEDIDKRNLPISFSLVNYYEFCFSYFLENYPIRNDLTRFEGKTGLEYLSSNVPTGINKTFSGIDDFLGKIFGELKTVAIIVLLILIILFFIRGKF